MHGLIDKMLSADDSDGAYTSSHRPMMMMRMMLKMLMVLIICMIVPRHTGTALPFYPHSCMLRSPGWPGFISSSSSACTI